MAKFDFTGVEPWSGGVSLPLGWNEIRVVEAEESQPQIPQ